MTVAAAAQITSSPIAPAWLIVPLAAIALLVVAAHVLILNRTPMPASRKRIRIVNGMLMMFTIPLTAMAFSAIAPTQQRLFVMLWMLVVGLIVLILLLAIADLANTWLMHRTERRALRVQLAAARALLAAKKTTPETRHG